MYLSRRVKYGRIVMPERVVFDHRPPLARASAKFTRHAASQFVYAGSQQHSLLCSRQITKLSHPPTLGGGPGGQQGKLPVRSSYLSFHPSRATKYKIRFTLIPNCGPWFRRLVCYVRYQGRLADRRPAAHGGRRMGGGGATAYCGGKQS